MGGGLGLTPMLMGIGTQEDPLKVHNPIKSGLDSKFSTFHMGFIMSNELLNSQSIISNTSFNSCKYKHVLLRACPLNPCIPLLMSHPECDACATRRLREFPPAGTKEVESYKANGGGGRCKGG